MVWFGLVCLMPLSTMFQLKSSGRSVTMVIICYLLSNSIEFEHNKYVAIPYLTGGRCGLDRMVVGFTTTYAISAYHH
jgi:hypothetical protein